MNRIHTLTARRWFAALLLVLPVTLRAAEVQVAADTLLVAPLKSLAALLKERTGHTVKVTSGPSEALLTQVKGGGTFDLWMGIHAKLTEGLEKDGLTEPNGRFVFAQGKLVLWSGNISRVDATGSVLGRAHVRSVAVVAPDKDPHGEATAALLDKLNMTERLTPKLMPVDSLALALEMARTDQADLAFVTLAQVLYQGRVASGSAWVVPPALYPALKYEGVLLKSGTQKAAAKALVELIQSPEGQRRINSFGYGP
jgi:molybdate transport system substrate-binding protein